MKLTWLAIKQLRHSARSYAAFFLSSTVAVWLFYLYGSLLFNPEVRQSLSQIPEVWRQIQNILLFIEALVGLFSLFFIRYSQTAFIRSRQASLAMLGLLGMEPRRIRQSLVWESLVLGLGAIILGIGLGAVFSRLFYMAAARFLPMQPPGLSFSWQAALLVLPTYLVIFAVTAWIGSRQIVRRPVADVLREAVSPKAPPRLSVWRVAFCVAALGSAYALALQGLMTGLEDYAYYVMILLVPGLYLLFTQATVAILGLLRRRRRFFWRGTNLFIVAQMLFKVRDNAMVLFMVATLATVAVTGLGWAYTGYCRADLRAEASLQPDLIMLGSAGAERLDAILTDARVRSRFQIPMLKAATTRLASADGVVYREARLFVMRASEFNRWRGMQGLSPLIVPEGRAAHITPVPGPDTVGTQLQLAPAGGGGAVELLPTFRVNGEAFGQSLAEALILSDQTFAAMSDRFGADSAHIWMVSDWRSLRPALAQARQELRAPIISKVDVWDGIRHSYAMIVFLIGFVGLLFILATGNMLYFKLFTDLEADRQQLAILHKLGLSERELRRIPTAQAAVMFGVPVLTAIIHGVILIPLVDAKVGRLITFQAVAVVAGIFVVLYGIYFLITRQSYISSLRDSWGDLR